jgi:hypothetical protein
MQRLELSKSQALWAAPLGRLYHPVVAVWREKKAESAAFSVLFFPNSIVIYGDSQ